MNVTSHIFIPVLCMNKVGLCIEWKEENIEWETERKRMRDWEEENERLRRREWETKKKRMRDWEEENKRQGDYQYSLVEKDFILKTVINGS